MQKTFILALVLILYNSFSLFAQNTGNSAAQPKPLSKDEVKAIVNSLADSVDMKEKLPSVHLRIGSAAAHDG